MSWDLEEAIAYYKRQGAPGEQGMLTALLKEIQQEHGGSIPVTLVAQTAQSLGVKESYLLALIRRIPSLRLGDGHCLEICAGPNCGRHSHIAALAEKLCAAKGSSVTVKYVPCMRLCGKGPNIKWDGQLYHRADESLLYKLLKDG